MQSLLGSRFSFGGGEESPGSKEAKCRNNYPEAARLGKCHRKIPPL